MGLSFYYDEVVLNRARELHKTKGLIPRFALMQALKENGQPESEWLRLHATFMIRAGAERRAEKQSKKMRIRSPQRSAPVMGPQKTLPFSHAEASQPKD